MFLPKNFHGEVDMRSKEPAFSSSEIAELIDEYGRFVDITTAAKITTVSRRTLGRYVNDGVIKMWRVGPRRAPRFKTRELVALFERVA